MKPTVDPPILGVDTAVWLSARTDAEGARHFYIGSATTNQRLNIPTRPLNFDLVDGKPATLTVRVVAEFVSGLSSRDSRSRLIDHLYAMSRCSVSALISHCVVHLPSSPLYCVKNRVEIPCSLNVRVRLDVETIRDLLELRDIRLSEEYMSVANSIRLGRGDHLVVAIEDATGVVLLGQRLEQGLFEAVVFCESRDRVLSDQLFVPTFQGIAPIGSIDTC